MNFDGISIGIAMTGSFCTFSRAMDQMQGLVNLGANVIPIFSYNAQTIDTRFGQAKDFMKQAEEITGNKIVTTIDAAEPLGPKNKLDLLLICPCTGNTLSKLNFGITDTPVLMAAKGHLRNLKPIVLCIATNDALGINFTNIGSLLAKKHIYFVPFGQDDFRKKPNSMLSDFTKVPETIEAALNGIQYQPVMLK